MRVLYINPTFPPDYTGGAEVSIYHAMRGLMQRGIECTLLVVNNRQATDVDQWYSVDDIPTHRMTLRTRLPGQATFDPRIYRIVRRELAATRPDLVHINNVSGMSLAPFLACQHAGVPVIDTLHDLWLLCPNNMRYRTDGSFCDPAQFPNGCHQCFRNYQYWAAVPQRKRIFQRLTANVHTFISPSQALLERHVEAGYDRRRFRLLQYGFAEAIPTEPQDRQVRQIERSAPEHRTLVFAGGGSVNKGPQVVLDAIPTLIDQIENLRIIVAGGGEDRFLAQFRRYDPVVQVLSRIDFADMRSLFANADLTLVASTWHENSPVVIYENFQVGTPCVGSNFGGIPELITEDKTGYLFPPGDGQGLAEKVLRHFQKPAEQRRQMRRECVKTARQRFNFTTYLDTLCQLYGEVLHG
ncbi:MAG: glycosyltransferase [Chloroflexi bacterium]|nr:glycosyltransferase [Chloroflexota bacterium]